MYQTLFPQLVVTSPQTTPDIKYTDTGVMTMLVLVIVMKTMKMTMMMMMTAIRLTVVSFFLFFSANLDIHFRCN